MIYHGRAKAVVTEKDVAAAENQGRFIKQLYNHCLFFKSIDYISVVIDNGHFNSQTAIQAVGSTAQSWIIGTNGHLHFVEDGLVIDAVSDQLRGCLLDR